MKKITKKLFILGIMLTAFVPNIQANTVENTSSNQSNEMIAAVNEEAMTDSAKIMNFLLDDRLATLTVKKVVLTGENGDTLRYDDGSVKYYYFFVDKDGNFYNISIIDNMLKVRGNATKAILATVGGGALTGALSGLASGGLKGALKGGAVGLGVGAVASIQHIKTIKKINKNLKSLRKILEPYRETFTEEGLPKDPKADLSKVKGLGDLDNAEALSGDAAKVKEEFDTKNANVTELANIDLDAVFGNSK